MNKRLIILARSQWKRGKLGQFSSTLCGCSGEYLSVSPAGPSFRELNSLITLLFHLLCLRFVDLCKNEYFSNVRISALIKTKLTPSDGEKKPE